MPLPIAHSLFGASFIAAVHPEPTRRYFIPLVTGAFLANAADFDFLLVFLFNSREWHRGFTHSILFAFVLYLVFLWFYGKHRFREATAYGLAYASHCFLDFITTKNGGGVELLFPFSAERFFSGWIGLSEGPSKMTVVEIMKALSLELAIFFPLLLLMLCLRRYAVKDADTTIGEV
jgi:membrane-bound metal-dependent hydrolase YbcI (DUF457 family)